MSRFVNIQVITIGLLIILRIAGIETGLDWMLEQVGLGCLPGEVGCTISDSNFFGALAVLYATMAGIGIVATLLVRGNFDWIFIGGVAIAALNAFFLFGAFDTIINSATGWGASAIYLFFGLFGILYTWSLFEFVMNR